MDVTTFVRLSSVKGAQNRENAVIVANTIVEIAKVDEGVNCPILSAKNVSERLPLD
jgi:hypothetical protein